MVAADTPPDLSPQQLLSCDEITGHGTKVERLMMTGNDYKEKQNNQKLRLIIEKPINDETTFFDTTTKKTFSTSLHHETAGSVAATGAVMKGKAKVGDTKH